LDFDESSLFADAMGKVTSGEIFFLASGRFRSRKTAAVLCDDPWAISVAPGTAALRYAIYSTMFHRSLFDLVVFSSGDPRLIELAAVLNAGHQRCRGFEAVLVARGRVSRRLRLRHFFGAPVEATHLAGILPARPSDGFIDDIDHFVTDDDTTTSKTFPNQFVQVRLKQGNVELIERGRFRSDPRHETLRRHIAYGPCLKPPLRYPVRLAALIGKVLSGLSLEDNMHGSGEDAGSEVVEPRRVFEAICRYLQSENGYNSAEWECYNDIVPYLPCCSVMEWYKRIRAGLDSLSGDSEWEPEEEEEEEERESLESEDYDDSDDEAATEPEPTNPSPKLAGNPRADDG
jgi:hypothetical protein